jgi:hypothetical protein
MGMLMGFLDMEHLLASMVLDPMAVQGMLVDWLACHHGMQERQTACLGKDPRQGMLVTLLDGLREDLRKACLRRLVDLLAFPHTVEEPRMCCRRMTEHQWDLLAMALGMMMASTLGQKRQSMGTECKKSERKEWASKKTLDHKRA